MRDIRIEATNSTPSIVGRITVGTVYVRGVSNPEVATEFYTPLFNWVVRLGVLYESKAENLPLVLSLSFSMRYVNSLSLRTIGRLCVSFMRLREHVPCRIVWHYEPGDRDMREMGEDLLSVMEFSDKEFILKELDAPMEDV